MEFISTNTRLGRYGLSDKDVPLEDLKLTKGDHVILSPNNNNFQKHMQTLKPKSIADLKRWIGVPDRAFGATSPPVVSRLPAVHLPVNLLIKQPLMYDQLVQTHNFIYGNSSTFTSEAIARLDQFVSATIGVVTFLFPDIYISAGSTLEIDAKTQLLFANNIVIEDTGMLVLAGWTTSIDCAGIRSVAPNISGGGGGGGGGGQVGGPGRRGGHSAE